MNKNRLPLDYSHFKNKSANLFLILLICGDLAYILLHFIILLNPDLKNYQYSLEMDRGFPEMYQYLKWLWIIIILIYISAQNKSYSYISWALVFSYFFLDDAMKIHEHVGEFFASVWVDNYTPQFGLRLEDFGELASSAIAGVILLSLLTVTYLKTNEIFRKMSKDLVLLILILVFFGIGVDMLHVATMDLGWKVSFILGVIEDGGEMITASFIAWYVFLMIESNNKGSYLFELFPKIFAKKS